MSEHLPEHLPECRAHDIPGWTIGDYICDRLRACEQRVRVNERDWRDQAFGIGYAAALDAAREAVAALENMGGYPPSVFDHIKEDVIDAIDALRGER